MIEAGARITFTPEGGSEIELVEFPERERILSKALEAVRSQFEFIVIDCPPSLGLLTLNALTANGFSTSAPKLNVFTAPV